MKKGLEEIKENENGKGQFIGLISGGKDSIYNILLC